MEETDSARKEFYKLGSIGIRILEGLSSDVIAFVNSMESTWFK